ncbi:MAG: hypothetical protein AMXMBFR64_49960 [Myxococcales bacterium]
MRAAARFEAWTAVRAVVWGASALLLAATLLLACESKGGGGVGGYSQGGGAGTGSPICRTECPKGCSTDTDCPLSEGQICCNYGSFGSACIKAKNCPRFCTGDSQCDTAQGEICCRTNPLAPEKVCDEADDCVVSCTSNADCGEGTICCTAGTDPICTKPNHCPKVCEKAQDCASGNGEVCCFTRRDHEIATWGSSALAAGGVCTNLEETPCPVACTSSQQCPQKTPICCPTGFCDESCDQPCTTNNDCNLSKGEFCCESQVMRSPWYDD